MSSSSSLRWAAAAAGVLIALVLIAAGCGSSDSGGTKIALLLPENETPRYETNDRPDFEAAVEELCNDCEVLYSNAGGDAQKQQSQAEAALTQGAEVLVVDPMDSKSAAAIAEKAKAQNVPVLSYDRLIENGEIDAYVSFDNEKVGELQAETLAKKLKEDGSASGPIIMINGDPADPNAALFKKGAHNGFDAANDDTGGGAIAALKGAGLNPEEVPVTGQDATVAGLQRILAGQQFMTVYKEITPEAKVSAEIAIALAEGDGVPQDKVTEELNNGKVEVPSVLLKPIAVTKDNVKSTVVADGFVTASELCTSAYATACKEAGISG
jgi:D-xylose transport system substrate-binding protein